MDQSEPIVLSVIIVTFNSAASLEASLLALKQALTGYAAEVVIVDNNSDDNSVELARSIVPDLVLVANTVNRGFAAACNAGAAVARGRHLLFHNPDLQLDADALEHLLAVYQTDHRVGVVGGRLRFPDGRFQPTCRRFPNIYNIFLSRGSLLSRLFPGASGYTLPDYARLTEVDAVAGTLLMVGRGRFTSIGGFDERFFMYVEDTDLSYRVRQLGCRNYFQPAAGGVHLWGKGSRAGAVRRLYYHHVSTWKYFLKHLPNGFSLILLPIMLLVNLVMMSVVAQFRRPGGA